MRLNAAEVGGNFHTFLRSLLRQRAIPLQQLPTQPAQCRRQHQGDRQEDPQQVIGRPDPLLR
jgi:hypothetical protein